MINDKLTADSVHTDRETAQFTLLCDYGDIILHKRTIVEVEGKYHIYQVLPPYPTFEEYSKGDEFEDGELLFIADTWNEAHKAQISP